MILPLITPGVKLWEYLTEVARVLVKEDERNFKKGQRVVFAQGEQLVIKSPNGARWALEIDNAGAASWVSVP